MKFFEQYKHPKWQEKRLLVLQSKNFKCQECGKKDQELHVHHPYYLKDTMVWDYPDDVLKCLCKTCHEKVHALDDRIKRWLAELPYTVKLIAFASIKDSVRKHTNEKEPHIDVPRKQFEFKQVDGESMSDALARHMKEFS